MDMGGKMKYFVLELLHQEGYNFQEYNSEEEAIKSYNDSLDFDSRIGFKTTDLILIKGEIVKRIPSEDK
jgi:hypothetical protein